MFGLWLLILDGRILNIIATTLHVPIKNSQEKPDSNGHDLMTKRHDDGLFNVVDEVGMMQVEEKDRNCNNGHIAGK